MRESSVSVPTKVRPVFEEILRRMEEVARNQLSAEYIPLLREAAIELARKRSYPLLHGEAASWACGITHAIGANNFLFDRTTTPSLSAAELARAFGVGTSTGAAKAAEVRKLLKIQAHDPRWWIRSRLLNHPLVWLVEVDGGVADLRRAPIEVQCAAFEQGLIPFVPAEEGDRRIGGHVGAGVGSSPGAAAAGPADVLERTSNPAVPERAAR